MGEIAVNIDPTLGFETSTQRLKTEWGKRKVIRDNTLKFGVTFLDRVLEAILPTDIILLGAVTGAGKTEVATQIAFENAMKGKRIHFFALEAEDTEIERRLLFKAMSSKYYLDPEKPRIISPNYLNWYLGKDGDVWKKYSDVLNQADWLGNLHTFYRTNKRFGIEDFKKKVLALNGKTDLIICDHIHYFDLDHDNENKAVGSIIKGMRDLALVNKVPIIVIAHLRKTDGKNKKLIPTMDDFHGTSDLGKICTKSVILAPGGPVPNTKGVYYTYCRFGKCRVDGARTRFQVRAQFDATINMYRPDYELGTLNSDQTEFKAVRSADSLPTWLSSGAK